MFDLGMQELIVIFVVALLVFGPKKLPELARSMGQGIAHLKKAMTDIKSEVDKEIKDASEQVTHEVPTWKDVVDVDKIKKDLRAAGGESGSEGEIYGVQKEMTETTKGEKKEDGPDGKGISENGPDDKREADT